MFGSIGAMGGHWVSVPIQRVAIPSKFGQSQGGSALN